MKDLLYEQVKDLILTHPRLKYIRDSRGIDKIKSYSPIEIFAAFIPAAVEWGNIFKIDLRKNKAGGWQWVATDKTDYLGGDSGEDQSLESCMRSLCEFLIDCGVDSFNNESLPL